MTRRGKIFGACARVRVGVADRLMSWAAANASHRAVDELVEELGGELGVAEWTIAHAFNALTDRDLNDGMARARAGVILQAHINDTVPHA